MKALIAFIALVIVPLHAFAWTPEAKDVEDLRQALTQILPPGYKVSPYEELGDTKGFAIVYDASRADSKLPEGPQIGILLSPKMEVAEWRRLNGKREADLREYKNLSKEERSKRRKELLGGHSILPAAYFRSLGISVIASSPGALAERYQEELKAEEKRTQLIENMMLMVVTLYEEAPDQAPQPASGKTSPTK